MLKCDGKPISPSVDLRDMLRSYILRRSLEHLNNSSKSRHDDFENGRFFEFKNRVLSSISDYYGGLPVDADAPTPCIKPVSSFEKQGYRLENILFESFPGWEVNATVYVPLDLEPPFPAVIVPVGHSGKQFPSYQLPCQYFAKRGYLAVTFDPPGQAGEKQEGNDHFIDGVRCYLVGETSSRYFIADALRSIDYLETRGDVDLSKGVAMTGVSGGGTTAITAGLIDERITVLGPSCCVVPSTVLDLDQCYCGCPETHMWARYARGLDDVDLVCALAPKPMLLMAGEFDEVFNIEDVRTLSAEVEKAYKSAGAAGNYHFYVSPGGHSYSLDQARSFVEFMDQHLLRREAVKDKLWPSEELALDPCEEMRCRPRIDVNMHTLTLDRAENLEAKRKVSFEKVTSAVKRIAGVDDIVAVPESIESKSFPVWDYLFQNILLKPETGIELPSTYVAPENKHDFTVVHFDDKGRDRLLHKGGLLTKVMGFLMDDIHRCGVMSVDLRGWGDSAPCLYPYDMANWGGVDRFLAYSSAALGDSVLGMRIRDGLSAVAYVKNLVGPMGQKIIVSGSGLGGIIALHVAAADADVAGIVVWDCLVSFLSLLNEAQYTWPADAFLPNVLSDYDIPSLLSCLKCPVKIVRALDGAGRQLSDEAIGKLNHGIGSEIYSNGMDDAVLQAFAGVFDCFGRVC